jgi:hypothetical protein
MPVMNLHQLHLFSPQLRPFQQIVSLDLGPTSVQVEVEWETEIQVHVVHVVEH